MKNFCIERTWFREERRRERGSDAPSPGQRAHLSPREVLREPERVEERGGAAGRAVRVALEESFVDVRETFLVFARVVFAAAGT